jgi:hypothetical protein
MLAWRPRPCKRIIDCYGIFQNVCLVVTSIITSMLAYKMGAYKLGITITASRGTST